MRVIGIAVVICFLVLLTLAGAGALAYGLGSGQYELALAGGVGLTVALVAGILVGKTETAKNMGPHADLRRLYAAYAPGRPPPKEGMLDLLLPGVIPGFGIPGCVETEGSRSVGAEGGVRLVFHTYHGVLLWVVQTLSLIHI